jgi:hypothetical protein
LKASSYPKARCSSPAYSNQKTDIKHPELIAQRIARYANLVGRENVIAGSDCGYGTWVGQAAVDPDVVWAKMAAMAEGARMSTKQFWKGWKQNLLSPVIADEVRMVGGGLDKGLLIRIWLP